MRKYSWMIFILCFLLGCKTQEEIEIEKKEKEKVTIRSSYYLSTVLHDEHLFVLSSYGYFIHHPDCPCCKLTKIEKTVQQSSPVIIENVPNIWIRPKR